MERWGGRRNNGQSCEKAKAKPAAKMENRKMCWGARQRIDRQLSNYNLRRLLCPKSGRQREAPPILVAFTKEFFLSWPEWFSFFLLWTCFPFVSFFFYQNLSSAFAFSTRKQLFHEQRASTSEFCKVRKVNKIWKKKKKKNEPHWERLPRKFPQGTGLGPRLWHLPGLLTFLWKYVFPNYSGAFKDFINFLMETLRWMFEFSLVK